MSKKTDSSLMIFIRSLIFSVLSLITIIIYSIICVCALPFPLRYRHSLIRLFLGWYMAMFAGICRVKYQIEGLENIPLDRFGIIMCKHQSTWETFQMPLLFHEPAVILKRELLWVPFFGWALAVSDPIAINRSDKASAMQQVIEKGKQRLAAGRFVLFFPEGTRVPAGYIGHYKLGGARLAAATGAPVIPIAHNAGRIWPRRKFLKYPGTIRLIIGPAIPTVGRTPEEILALTKQWIETTMVQIDGPQIEGFINKSAR